MLLDSRQTKVGKRDRAKLMDQFGVWESAEKIMRLLRIKCSLCELKDQKGEYATPCDEQLCQQESSQATLMDKGEIEVEEERRVRAKRVSFVPTDKEEDESEIMHVTIRSQCETEDSLKCSTTQQQSR